MLFRSPQELLVRAIVLLIAMTVHEFAHVYVAYRMGDMTGANQGRLTLNPLVHINPVGFIMGVLIGFGILGSAPINPYQMRNPRWGYLAAVGAGPASNLLLAVVFAIPFHFIPDLFLKGIVGDLFFQLVFMNVLLALFNLIPLGPLDGWSILYTLLPREQAIWWERNRTNSQYVFMGLILLSFVGPSQLNILGNLVFQPALSIVRFLIVGL